MARLWWLAAFVSGAAALVWELVWLRELGELLGSTRLALSIVLAVLFGGLGVGTWAGPWLVRRTGGARAVAIAELFIAVSALGLGATLGWIEGAYDAWAPPTERALPLRTLAAACAIGLPSFALGLTWPAFVAATRGAALGALYAANTAGGVAGTLIAVFLALPHLGVLGASLAAAAANVAVSLFAWSRRRESVSVEPVVPARVPVRCLLAAAFSGLAAIGLEVTWARALSPHLGGTVYSVAAVLAVYLAALATGGALDALLARSRLDARAVASWAALGAGTGAIASLLVLGRLAAVSSGPRTTTASEAGVALAVIFLPALAFGLFLPALARATRANETGVAHLWAANTLGGVVGSPLAALVVLPEFGLALALLALALVPATLGAALFPRASMRGGLVLASVVLAWAAWRFGGDPRVWAEAADDRLVTYVEGRAASIAVVETSGRGRVLKIDGNYRLGSSRTGFAQRRQGLIPLCLAPSSPQSALFLGTATGSSVGAAANWPLERTTGLEIVPGVLELLPLFDVVNDGLAERTDVQLVQADAKHFVRTDDRAWDVIVGDLFVPWRAGEGAMYTREHLSATAERLSPDGIFVQWLPLYQLPLAELRTVVATFLDVFEDVQLVWLHFQVEQPAVGVVAAGREWTPPVDRFERVAARAAMLARDGLADPAELDAAWIAGREALVAFAGDAPLETRDRPRIEFAAPRVRNTPRLEIAAENVRALLELGRSEVLEGSSERGARLRTALAHFFRARLAFVVEGDAAAAEREFELALELAPEWGFIQFELERFRRTR